MRARSDFLVLGRGIAGLSFALRAAEHGSVAVVTKKGSAESATNYAQGGIAAVTSPEDSFEEHVRDTLVAGAGLCHEDVVRFVIERGPAAVRRLVLSGNMITDRGEDLSGLKAFCEVLLTLKHPISLDLANCGLGVAEVSEVAKAIGAGAALNSLKCANNPGLRIKAVPLAVRDQRN